MAQIAIPYSVFTMGSPMAGGFFIQNVMAATLLSSNKNPECSIRSYPVWWCVRTSDIDLITTYEAIYIVWGMKSTQLFFFIDSFCHFCKHTIESHGFIWCHANVHIICNKLKSAHARLRWLKASTLSTQLGALFRCNFVYPLCLSPNFVPFYLSLGSIHTVFISYY